MDRSEWMAEVCRHAALTMEAHGLGNRTEQLRNVADQLAAAPPPPAEQASGERLDLRARELLAENYRTLGVDAQAQIRTGPWTLEQDAAIRALIAALSQRPVVDEAAIDRALAAWFALPSQTSDQSRMRAALTAALAPQQPEKGEG